MATRKRLPTVKGEDVLKILSLMSDSIVALEAVIKAMGGKKAVLVKGRALPKGINAVEAGFFIVPGRILAPVCKPDTPTRYGTLSNPATRAGVGRKTGGVVR